MLEVQKVVIFIFLVSNPINVSTRCMQPIVTKNGTHRDFNGRYYLYPLTVSKANQSYNMPMILKEIAYREDYIRNDNVIFVKTYDFCNDMSTLIEILLDLFIETDPYWLSDEIVIHGNIEQIKIAELILAYLGVISPIFIITNYGYSDSFYNGDAYYEKPSGFIEASKITHTNSHYILSVSICYKKAHTCQCLPIEETTVLSGKMVYFSLGDWSDVLQMKETLTALPDRKTKNLLIYIKHLVDIEGVTLIRVLQNEYYGLFRKVLFRATLYNNGQYSNHNINCNQSLFLNKGNVVKHCKRIYQVKSLLLRSGNIDPKKTDHVPITSFNDYHCKPTCSVGKTIYFNKTIFIWECILCTNNSVKSEVGNAECKQCLHGWVANINKTSCYDTYTNLTLTLVDDASILMLSGSGVLLSCVSSTIFLYIKYHETPVVRSSNILLSGIQLSANLFLVMIMPFLFIGEPNMIICMLRPAIVGLLLTVAASVTLTKTRTLLYIFQSQIKLSRSRQNKIKVTEPFIVLMFVLLSTSILLISFKYEMPDVTYRTIDETKYREKYCDNDNQIMFQLAWIFLVLFFNTVQAFRARHLPENYKETRIIILANILSCVIVGNVLWLSFFQSNHYWKSIFIFYAVLSLNAINFFILYGYKVYIILFAPEKNTRRYFKTKISNTMEMKGN